VAKDPNDYVRLAVSIASDRAYQRELKRRILERRQALAACDSMVEEFANFLFTLAPAAR
jgi:predicted O-linked N-acetylglucosamine transferase (SPINDLY family)